MQIFVFEGPTIFPGRAYGFDCEQSGINLPANFGPWSLHSVFDLISNAPPLVPDNGGEALANIVRQGFHIQAFAKNFSGRLPEAAPAQAPGGP